MKMKVTATYTVEISDEMAFREDGFRELRQTQPGMGEAYSEDEQTERLDLALAALMPRRVPTADGAKFKLSEMSFQVIS